MKGFKDKSGKFRPTENKNGVRKSRDQTAKTQGVRLKRNADMSETRTYKVWKYEDAPPDVQEKILENWRDNYSGQESWYADDDGILYSEDQKIVGYEIFKGNIPKYWDLDRGAFIQFELEIKDKNKFKKAFGISDALWNKIDVRFENGEKSNTKMEFLTESTRDIIDLEQPYKENPTGYDNFADIPKDEIPTRKEYESLQKANKKFELLMYQSFSNLKRSYEWEFSDEYIIEHVKANDYKFTEDGKID